MPTRKAVYPGSFDPITKGHMDIVHRAKSLVDEVHIALFLNPTKQPLFEIEERIAILKELYRNDDQVVISSFNGLIVDYCEEQQIYTIIRGLRAVSDFDYEFQMSLTNRKLNDKIDTVFLMTDEKYSYLSSTIVKQVSRFDGEISQFVPEIVVEALKRKMDNE